jgi:hypothetical protein
MKILKINKAFKVITGVLMLMIVFSSCKKEDDLGEAPRLFRPTMKGDLASSGNFIEASWQKVKNASSYTIQISRDTFKTIDLSIEVDSNVALIEELRWEQLYQVQVKANAADSAKNSKFGILGAIKTPRFPTIVIDPQLSDVGITSVLFKWRTEGKPVTRVKVVSMPQETVLKEIVLSTTDISNSYLLIEELPAETSLKVELYSGNEFRGDNRYITKAPLSGDIIDLTGITGRPTILADTLGIIPSGATVLLKRGETYSMSTVVLSKPVTIMSGENPLNPTKAIIFFDSGSNFNLPSGANIDFIRFTDVHLRSNDGAGKYVFNPNTSGNVGEIMFESCLIETFRGVARFRGALTVNTFSINNSVIDSIGGYGIVNVDDVNTRVNNISITNSTISRADVILASRSAAKSVIINNSTFFRAPLGGKYIVDHATITDGIQFNNNIFGPGRGTAATVPVTAIHGYKIATVTAYTANNFGTSDFTWANATTSGFTNFTIYTKPSTDVFLSPLTRDFAIKDNSFSGKSTAGDPRWRIQ